MAGNVHFLDGDSGKQLTFLGANAGISANDADGGPNDAARGQETIITCGGTEQLPLLVDGL